MVEKYKVEMKPRASSRNATIHAAYQDCDSLEEFAEATSGWEFDWQQLDRGPFKARLLQVETPSTLVSQFRVNRKFHQRGVSPPGMRTFGIVGVQSSPVEWKGREWSKNHLEVFPTSDLYESVSNPGFRGDGLSIPEDRIRSTAKTLGLPDPLERACPQGLVPSSRIPVGWKHCAGAWTSCIQQFRPTAMSRSMRRHAPR